MPASKAQRAATAERRSKAIALRLAGVDFQAIANQLGYASRGACHTDINRALEQHLAQTRESAEVLRHQELARLDRLQAAHWAVAVAGDTKATDTVLKIVDRRCRILGLDAPQRHEVLTLDAVEAEIARLTAELSTTPSGNGTTTTGQCQAPHPTSS